MKLWVDDIRRAPLGWVWARTNEEAKVLLSGGTVTECSLDHDMGLHGVEIPDDPDELLDLIYSKDLPAGETGLDLVDWMCEHNIVPQKIRIHSWSPDGAKAMARRLNDFGYNCEVRAFDPKDWPENKEINPYTHRSYGG